MALTTNHLSTFFNACFNFDELPHPFIKMQSVRVYIARTTFTTLIDRFTSVV